MKFRNLPTGFIAALTLATAATVGSALPLLHPSASFSDAVSFGAEQNFFAA
jgi:hypothetical protein